VSNKGIMGNLGQQLSHDECQILYNWTPKFLFVKPLVLLFSNIFG
jgi:hypothetical protein